MNLSNLFKLQTELDKHIIEEKGLQGQDLLDKKILWLLSELGELANNWRGFKYASEDQEPRLEHKVMCHACRGLGGFGLVHDKEICGYCNGTGLQEDRNPLLEEFVDCLHLLLSIGLELGLEHAKPTEEGHFDSITESFIQAFREISMLVMDIRFEVGVELRKTYTDLFGLFIGLGAQLGFTWEQIEQAYLDKNKVNHARQDNGY